MFSPPRPLYYRGADDGRAAWWLSVQGHSELDRKVDGATCAVIRT